MYNQATLIGNIGKEPEVRQTASGAKVCSFSLATTDKWKDHNGQWQEKTEWHSITAWNKLADIISQYGHKGMRVMVVGAINYQTYEKDGQKHYKTEIKAETFKILDKRENDGQNSTGYQQPSQQQQTGYQQPSQQQQPYNQYQLPSEDDFPF